MKNDLISRSALLEDINDNVKTSACGGLAFEGREIIGVNKVRNRILKAPAVDAVEVVHGRWEEIHNAYGELEGWLHTDCGREVKCKENYCPNCGAKMDGGEDDV